MEDEAIGRVSPEETSESHTQSCTDQLQGSEVLIADGQMETGVSVSGNVAEAFADHEVVSELCTAEITPNLNEVMEMCVSEQDRDQHPETPIGTREKESTGHKVVPDSGTAEITPKRSEQMDTSVSEQIGDQLIDAEKKTVQKDTVSPLIGGGGSLALLSMQYRDESSDDLSDR